MDAIIMCAGLGTRMRPLTNDTPKPLVPVLGKGTLERLLEMLPAEITRVVIVENYLGEKIKEKIGNTSHGRPVIYAHQDPLDGSGGALRQAKAQVPDLSDRFLIINGDDLYAASDLQRLAQTPFGLLVLESVAPRDIDVCKVEDGRVTGFTEAKKGEAGIINVGAYLFDHRWFETTPTLVPGKEAEYSLPHVVPQLVANGVHITAVPATFWLPVGTPEELQKAEDLLKAT
jgi:bifunctional UDP-N-acetylglucosamine pyrophosphorylase/glucosamine-1-phosphate N-acetyltransferase